jgi:hypothetical protein
MMKIVFQKEKKEEKNGGKLPLDILGWIEEQSFNCDLWFK